MLKSCLISAFLSLLVFSSPTHGQSDTISRHPRILPIQLLSGYKAEKQSGVDTKETRFFKDDGSNTQQAQPLQKERPARSPVLLLPNYKIVVNGGLEANYHGTISKLAGLSIQYEVDTDAPTAADAIETNKIAWKLSQILNDRSFNCVFTKANELVVTSPDNPTANFRAKIRNNKDLMEMLLMVLTFEPQEGYPAEPNAVVIRPIRPK